MTAAVSLCALGLTGCYRTVELTQSPPPAATRIVGELTPRAAEDLAATIGPEAVAVEGTFLEAREGGWQLAVHRVDHRSTSIRWNGELVLFPSDALVNVRERGFDRVRTTLFLGGVAAAASALAVAFIRATASGGGGGDGGGVPPQ